MIGLPWVAQQRRRLLRWYASANVNTNSQAVAFTLDGVTVAANQIAQHPQTAAFTLADVTVAASQTAQHPQSVAFSLADVVVSAVQTATHPQTVAFTLDDVVFAAVQGGAPPPITVIYGERVRSRRKRDDEEEKKTEHVTNAVFDEIKIRPRNILRLRQIRIEDTTSHLVEKGAARAKKIKQRRDEDDLMLMF